MNTKCFFFGHKWEKYFHPKYVTKDRRTCARCGCVQHWIDGHY